MSSKIAVPIIGAVVVAAVVMGIFFYGKGEKPAYSSVTGDGNGALFPNNYGRASDLEGNRLSDVMGDGERNTSLFGGKRNKTKRNKTKGNKTKRNKTKGNKI